MAAIQRRRRAWTGGLILACALTLSAANSVGADDVALVGGKSVLILQSRGKIEFKKDAGLTGMPDPTCDEHGAGNPSYLRLSTNIKANQDIELPCYGWTLKRGAYEFIGTELGNPGHPATPVEIRWKKGSDLRIVLSGNQYDPGLILPGAGVTHLDVRLTVGLDKFGVAQQSMCGRFTVGLKDTAHDLVLAISKGNSGTEPCPAPPTATPTNTPIATATPTSNTTPTETPGGPTRTPTPSPTITGTPTNTYTPSITPTPTPLVRAFRVSSANIRDPHLFIDPIGTGACFNITNPPGLAGISANTLINESMRCEPVDEIPCASELNIIAVFEPLNQPPDGPGGNLRFGLGTCEDVDGSGLRCTLTEEQPTSYTNQLSGSCLNAFAGTTGANNSGSYSPAVGGTSGPCAISANLPNFAFSFGDTVPISVPLQSVQFAGTYSGDPATSLLSGLLRGFISEAEADGIIIDIDAGFTQLSFPLSEVLAGGANSCAPAGSGTGNSQDDRDTNPPGGGGESGWWFYMNFEAEQVELVEP